MARQNGFIVEIVGNSNEGRDFGVIEGAGIQEVWQVSAKVLNAQGDQIQPVSGTLRLSVKPRGGSKLLEADEDIDLTLGDFYRPFNIKAEQALFAVSNLDPDTATVVISVDALEVIQ